MHSLEKKFVKIVDRMRRINTYVHILTDFFAKITINKEILLTRARNLTAAMILSQKFRQINFFTKEL